MTPGNGILNKLANLMGLDKPAGEVQRIGTPVGEPDALQDISTVNRVYDYYRKYTHLNPDRLSLYDDYDEMDQMTLLASALDLYAEDSTQADHEKGVALWIEAEDEEVKTELDKMLARINLEEDITAIARGIAKYGDDFEATMYNEEHGVFGLTFLEPKIVWRHEDKNQVLEGWSVGAAKKIDEKPNYKPWDIVHGLRKGRRRNEMYGDSILLPARLVYKILKLMEEQMVMYRLSMHPDRLVFYVDIGAASPDEGRTILDAWRRAMQKKQFFNPKTGQYQEEYNPWALDNNIYWATRPNSESKIEKLSGSSNVGEIFDVEYFRDLIFSAIRVPKAFLGFEGDINAKATLAQQDIRFARGVKGIQRATRMMIHRAGQIHLGLRQRNPRDRKYAFKTKMTPVSYLDEAQRADLYQLRFELLDRMSRLSTDFEGTLDQKKWLTYLLVDIAGFSKELVAKLMDLGGDEVQGDEDPTKDEKRALGEAIQSSPTARKMLAEMKEMSREAEQVPEQEVPDKKSEHRGISSLPATRVAEKEAEEKTESRRKEKEKARAEAYAAPVS